MMQIKVIGDKIVYDGITVANISEGLSKTFLDSFVEQIENDPVDIEEVETESYGQGCDEGYMEGYDKGVADTDWDHENDYEQGYQDGLDDAKKEDENYWSGR